MGKRVSTGLNVLVSSIQWCIKNMSCFAFNHFDCWMGKCSRSICKCIIFVMHALLKLDIDVESWNCPLLVPRISQPAALGTVRKYGIQKRAKNFFSSFYHSLRKTFNVVIERQCVIFASASGRPCKKIWIREDRPLRPACQDKSVICSDTHRVWTLCLVCA